MDTIVVTDDAGTTYVLTPRTEPGADGFTAELRPPIPAEASWLELSGGRERPVRLALYESPADSIKALPHQDDSPVEHYLRGLVSGVWPLLSSPALVDGVEVRIDTLAAGLTHLRVLGVCRPWPTPLDVPLSFTAPDDVGGWYAGVARDPAVGGALSWVLVPALDPAAGELTLTVSGPRQSLSVHLELT